MSVHKISYPKERNGLGFLLKLRKEKLNFFVRLSQKEGNFAGYRIMNDPILFLTDATAIQYIFQEKNNDYVRSKYVKFLKYLFSGGIFLSDGENWQRQRTEAAPAFANGNFPEMTSQMVRAIEDAFAQWDQKIEKGEYIDINREMTQYALDVALGSLFHLNRKGITDQIAVNLGILLRESETRIWSLISLPQSLTMKFPKYRKALKALRDIVDDLIAERRLSKAYPEDLLSRAIRSYETGDTTYKVLQDKVIAFMTSAHETSANSLVWALYELAQRPEIVKRIKDEAKNVLKEGDALTYEHVKQLQYTRQVFDEVLRLYPSVWTMSREASKDDILPLDNEEYLSVKKGTTIMLCPYAMHRRENYWPNPLAFDPERFSAEEIKKRPRMAYFPFAGGARLCLGFRFAQIEAVVALALIIQKYNISLVPGQDIHPEPNITLRPNREVLFALSKREAENVILLRELQSMALEEQNCPFHAKH